MYVALRNNTVIQQD